MEIQIYNDPEYCLNSYRLSRVYKVLIIFGCLRNLLCRNTENKAESLRGQLK